jgi:hypothetical protein
VCEPAVTRRLIDTRNRATSVRTVKVLSGQMRLDHISAADCERVEAERDNKCETERREDVPVPISA